MRHFLIVLALLSLPFVARAQSANAAQDSLFSAIKVVHTAGGVETVFIRNGLIAAPDTATIYLGNSAVTTATGYQVGPGVTVGPLNMNAGQKLYGITKAAADSVRVFSIWTSTRRVTP